MCPAVPFALTNRRAGSHPSAQAEESRPERANRSALGVLGFILAVLTAVSCSSGVDTTTSTPTLPAGLTRITFVNQSGSEIDLLVEIADDAQERPRGLMLRETLPESHGMLFVFEQEGSHGFWMKDTIIPLSIAFIGATGDIVDIQDMAPLDATLHTPAGPSLYAVEVNQGWFGRNDIEIGSTVNISGTTPAPSPSPQQSQR